MPLGFLRERFRQNRNREALVWRDRPYLYGWLLERLDHWRNRLRKENIPPGTVVVLEADFTPGSLALLLALIEHACILVPVSRSSGAAKPERIEVASGEILISVGPNEEISFTSFHRRANHGLYETLRNLNHPGLVLFSSGSSGKSKAAVHDFSKLFTKFQKRRHNLRTLAFLLFDHIGGLDTMLYSLSNGSCLVTLEDRSPEAVCRAIEKYRVEVLPVSPTFLNLLILSRIHFSYDLTSLQYVTYGTEVMPEATLRRCVEIFPQATLLQKYGMTEVGTLRSRSRSSDSLWVKVGGEGFQTRVVDGVLHIRAESAMLGYLNAPSPFTEDGWLNTGDVVEADGDYIRFLGRGNEIISVGGQKVFPAEVENIIQEMENIREVTVYGEKNPIVGQIVCAAISLVDGEERGAVIRRLTAYCRERLPEYKVPIKIDIVEHRHHSDRFKKVRPKNG